MGESGLLSKGKGEAEFLPLRLGPMWAGPLWAPLGACGPPWALAGRALASPLGHYNRVSASRHGTAPDTDKNLTMPEAGHERAG